MSHSTAAATSSATSYPYPVHIPMTPPSHSPHSTSHSLSLSLSSPHLYTPILHLPNMTPTGPLYGTDTPVTTQNSVRHQFPHTYNAQQPQTNIQPANNVMTPVDSAAAAAAVHTDRTVGIPPCIVPAHTSTNTDMDAGAGAVSVPLLGSDSGLSGDIGTDASGAPLDPALVLMNLKPRGQKHPKHYWCEICTKGFTQKGSLVKHMLTHSGEKPYKCTVEGCTRAFAQSGNLARHYRSHTDEKLFSCTYCNKNFRRRDTVRQHEMTHTAPYINAANSMQTTTNNTENNDNEAITAVQMQTTTHLPSPAGTGTSAHAAASQPPSSEVGNGVPIPELPQLDTMQHSTSAQSTPPPPSTTTILHPTLSSTSLSSPSYTLVPPVPAASAQLTLAPPTTGSTVKQERKRGADTQDTGSIIVKKQINASEAAGVLRRAKDIQPVQQWSLDTSGEDAYVLISAGTELPDDPSVPPGKQASAQRPFKCTRCNRGFKTRGAVIFHARTHLSERPFKCDVSGCDKSFKQKSNLLQHISSVHAQLRLYECRQCGRQFKTKFSAQQHEQKQRCGAAAQMRNNMQQASAQHNNAANTYQPAQTTVHTVPTNSIASVSTVTIPSTNSVEAATGTSASSLLMLSA